jgi:hypothetical protein
MNSAVKIDYTATISRRPCLALLPYHGHYFVPTLSPKYIPQVVRAKLRAGKFYFISSYMFVLNTQHIIIITFIASLVI